MADKTTEQLALEKSGDELVTAFSVLSDDNQKMAKADSDYDAIAAQRDQDFQAFVAANAAFGAKPSDASLLAKLLDAISALTASSQKQQTLKAAKDDADQTDSAAVTSHQAALLDFQAKVTAFVAANTPAAG